VENFIDKTEIGYNIFTTKRAVGIYGYKYILSKINLDTILFIKKYYSDYLMKHYERRGDYDVQLVFDVDLYGLFFERVFHL
jgi:hypothetical protein